MKTAIFVAMVTALDTIAPRIFLFILNLHYTAFIDHSMTYPSMDAFDWYIALKIANFGCFTKPLDPHDKVACMHVHTEKF